MKLTIYDTRQRKKVPFESLEPGVVKMYTCGPTVYADAHIGNMRTYMFEDLLRRTLKFFGYQVTQVMNLTDIDDKTIREARTTGKPLKQITDPIIQRFFNDLDALKIERAEFYTPATEHIDEMIKLISTLLDKGYAYVADNNVYYSVEKFANYGQLSGMNIEGLARGVRIDADEYDDKENYRDFALWKGWDEDDGDVGWDAPFGRGRPGWHVECSAMSMKYLGEEFDLHTGGIDNIFPHHENEIAQSVAATDKQFVRYWMHSAHLNINEEKMSKSMQNFFTLRDLLDMGHPARAIRYVLLSTHYRQTVSFSDESVNSAIASLDRLDTLYRSADSAIGLGDVRTDLQIAIQNTMAKFSESLADDLGIAGGMATLFDFVSAVHRLEIDSALNLAEGTAIKALWAEVDLVLGVLIPAAGLPDDIEVAVQNRIRMRSQRNFAESDKIRDQLALKGYQLEDTQTETVVIWSQGNKIVRL